MHPYENRPDHTFWRTGVTEQPWSDVQFVPSVPFKLSATDKVATGGSCFAQHIARHLEPLGLTYFVAEPAPPVLTPERSAELQYGVFSARYGNIYTVRQLRQLLEFAFGEKPDISLVDVDDSGRWFDLLRPTVSPGGFVSLDELQGDRASHLHCVRELFREADCFVFTLGLTEAWYDLDTGVVFPVCPGTRVGTYEPDFHKFVKFGYGDVARDLEWCVSFVAAVNPAMKWIFTVSPVALAATATDDHVLIATSASKAVLRAAVDEVCGGNERCAYFPSYEICSSAATFGQFLESDLRNISQRGVKLVMRVFNESFGLGAASESSSAVRDSLAHEGQPDVREQILAAVAAECDEALNDPANAGRG